MYLRDGLLKPKFLALERLSFIRNEITTCITVCHVVCQPPGLINSRQSRKGKGDFEIMNNECTHHFHTTQHPGIKSFEPGENWGWCCYPPVGKPNQFDKLSLSFHNNRTVDKQGE